MAKQRMQDPLAILGVRPGASKNEIKSAFRQRAKSMHPDIDKTPGSEDRFKQLRGAYEEALSFSDDRHAASFRRAYEHMARARQHMREADEASERLYRWHEKRAEAARAERLTSARHRIQVMLAILCFPWVLLVCANVCEDFWQGVVMVPIVWAYLFFLIGQIEI